MQESSDHQYATRVVAFGTVAPHRVADIARSLLFENGYEVIDVSPPRSPQLTWPAVGQGVAKLVANRTAATGIALCWTGSGVSISASTVPGARAAFCSSGPEARQARLWHDANVLAISLSASKESVRETVREWLKTPPSEVPEHIVARERLTAITAE